MRRLVALVGLIVAAAVLAGCTDGAITDARLQRSVGATFANLLVLKQAEQGYARTDAAALDTRATCHRGMPSEPNVGAASDWICTVTWLEPDPTMPAAATFDLNVQTDGCYAADGDGPAGVNGSAVMQADSGRTVTNPLWQFNGCFDTT